MSLERLQIRNTLTALLKGATDAGDNVHSSRSIVQLQENLPAVHVYTKSETAKEFSRAPRSYIRGISLSVEILTSDSVNSSAADQGDIIAAQVERIIEEQDQDSNSTLGCLVEKIELSGVDLEYESDGDSTINAVRLSYNSEYVRDASIAGQDDLVEALRIKAEYDVGTADDPDFEATDTINLRP